MMGPWEEIKMRPSVDEAVKRHCITAANVEMMNAIHRIKRPTPYCSRSLELWWRGWSGRSRESLPEEGYTRLYLPYTNSRKYVLS